VISILLPYRNRPSHLSICLKALDEATKYRLDEIELIVFDQSDKPSDPELFDHQFLFVRWYDDPQPANSIFHKSAVLNDLIGLAKGDLITVLDVDMMVQPNFLLSISEYFYHEENHHKKLGHRVRLLDPQTSKRFTSTAVGLGYDYLPRFLKMHHSEPLAAETFDNLTTGNAIYTMKTDLVKSLNGYDENYIGYGFEDIDFNLRAAKNGIETEIHTKSDIYHLHHPKGGWGDPEQELQNRQLFTTRKAEGFPNPPRPENWDLPPPSGNCCMRSKG